MVFRPSSITDANGEGLPRGLGELHAEVDAPLRPRLQAIDDPTMTLSRLTDLFLLPPLYSRSGSFPTLYTAVYRPVEGRVDYIWPGKHWSQSFEDFEEDEYMHSYG
ncbi:hypothetical protein [Rhizobium sp. 42MFCr.1]|uniref:hypothetical protein n=1 Tax=Rhizobium sp. 42MFCr.1 TaxID=1048680 RepID=UPI0003817B8E|nr:hypothetical protein [Rhizobium sp. 42MFCr.1]